MGVVTRAQANTSFGHDVAVFTADGADYCGLFTNVGLSFDADTVDGTTILDFDQYVELGASGATLDFSKVVESTLPLMILALSADPVISVVFRHSISGENYAGNFLITSAKWEAGDGPQSESVTAVLQGDITRTLPTITTAHAARTTQANTKFGHDVAEILIGTDSYEQLFDSVSVDVSIDTGEGKAALDTVRYPKPLKRSVTVTASKVVQSHATVATSALVWMELARLRAAVNVSIETVGAATIIANAPAGAGSFIVTNAKFDASDGAQKETITLVSQGSILAN